MKKRDIVGIAMGMLVFLAGLGALNGLRGAWWVGVTALFVSICLFVPSRVYEHRIAGAIGLLALTMATAVSVEFAVSSGAGAIGFLSNPHYEFAGLIAVIAAGYLIASAFGVSCACALAYKLRPRPVHAAAATITGIIFGALAEYLIYFQG